MQNELNTLSKNNTWDIVKSTNTSTNSNFIKPLKTRWVYKIKESPSNSNTTIEFKARFVAKGFEQLYGLDYIDSFAAVIKQIAWKIVFTIALNNNWPIYKIDMISAFTQGNIDTSLFLLPPEGLEYLNTSITSNSYLKLNKALYGLKQSARIWYSTLVYILVTELGYTSLKSESCIFINKSTNIIICIYVDDLAITGPNKDVIDLFIKDLKRFFNIKELGLISDYLGIEVIRTINT